MTSDAAWRAAKRRLVAETVAYNQAIAAARRLEHAYGETVNTRAAETRYRRAVAAERAEWARLTR